MLVPRRIKPHLYAAWTALRSIGKDKVFCIGRNKTGTTSVAYALKELGFVVARQRPAELLIHDWAKRDFRRLIRFCRTAQAFQDIPFSLPFTFQALDAHFPGSRFILTVRECPEEWYSSLLRFHSQVHGNGGIPSISDLSRSTYCYEGYAYDVNRAVFPSPYSNPYDRDVLIRHYNAHNESVIEYFRHRPESLLVLNIAEKGSYDQLCSFLGKRCIRDTFPWKNRTSDLTDRAE